MSCHLATPQISRSTAFDMKTLFLTVAVVVFALGARASDNPVMMVIPSGVPGPSPAPLPPPHPTQDGNVLCGDLNWDAPSGLTAQRWDSRGLESWVLVRCEFEEKVEIQGFNWLAMESSEDIWLGFADFAIWDAATVEEGCADDSNTLAAARDLANTREGPVVCTYNFCAWKYSVPLPQRVVLEPGAYYFAVRNVTEGQSFIMTVDCNGRPPIYFQSELFGYPCAVPSGEVFNEDLCVAIEVLGEPFCADDGCGRLRKLACKGQPGFKVVARGKGIPGGRISLNLDGEDTCVTVGSSGKWKFVQKNAPGSHTATACGSARSCTH